MIVQGQAARSARPGAPAVTMAPFQEPELTFGLREAAVLNAQSHASALLNNLRLGEAGVVAWELSEDKMRSLETAERLIAFQAGRVERSDQPARAKLLGAAINEIDGATRDHREHPLLSDGLTRLDTARDVMEMAVADRGRTDLSADNPAIARLDDRGAPEVSLEVGRLLITQAARHVRDVSGARDHPLSNWLDRQVMESYKKERADEAAPVVTAGLDRVLKDGRLDAGTRGIRGLDKGAVAFARTWIAGEPADAPRPPHPERPSSDQTPPTPKRGSRNDGDER